MDNITREESLRRCDSAKAQKREMVEKMRKVLYEGYKARTGEEPLHLMCCEIIIESNKYYNKSMAHAECLASAFSVAIACHIHGKCLFSHLTYTDSLWKQPILS